MKSPWKRFSPGLRFRLALLFAVLVFWSCGTTYVLTDVTGKEIHVDDLRFSEGDYLEVWQGQIQRKVAFEELEIMTLNPSRASSRKGILVYEVDMVLRKGASIQTDIKGVDTSFSFLEVQGSLLARTPSGELEIPLYRVRELAKAKL